ncbi:MAG: response regulator, partial [Gemmatimonadota bacterium]
TRALEAAALSDHPIALLLTDLVLPGESGAELAGTLCAERPGLPVIYMSGFQETELENRGILAGAAYITKPFTADVLTLMVRGAIGH